MVAETPTDHLKSLGSERTEYKYSGPNIQILEVFPNPVKDSQHLVVDIAFPEFTSLCLDGDTLLDVATNETQNPSGIPIKDLVGKEGYIFSVDPTTVEATVKKFHSCRMTSPSAECVEVKMAYFRVKGPEDRYWEEESIICTPTHPFFVRIRWGEYAWVEAGKLRPGMRLVADQRSSDTIRMKSRHRLLAEAMGLLKDNPDWEVHHKDGNHFNNSPENIEAKSKTDHLSDHKTELYQYSFLDNDDLIGQYNAGENFYSLAKKYGCDVSTIYNRIQDKVVHRTQAESLRIKNKIRNEARQIEAVELYQSGYTTYEVAQYFGVHATTILSWLKAQGVEPRSANDTRYNRPSDLAVLNHKVVDVVPVAPRPVYNLEVEDTECFFANGVVVHNCPKTGQPDFATIRIAYRPRNFCVESKSLKLYFFAWRSEGCFMEEIVSRICDDLVDVLRPWWIRVVGEFAPRGAMVLHPTAEWEHPNLHGQESDSAPVADPHLEEE